MLHDLQMLSKILPSAILILAAMNEQHLGHDSKVEEYAPNAKSRPVQISLNYMGLAQLSLPCEVRAGFVVYQGDMLLERVRQGGIRTFGVGVNAGSSRWPSRTIYYAKDNSLSAAQKQVVDEAIAHWNDKANCIIIPKLAGTTAYVLFQNGVGCAAEVGYKGRKQDIFLDANCSTGNVIHEIGHAIGLMHEHSRNDRDAFVDYHPENVKAGKEQEFAKVGNAGVNLEPYDYGSIMHYPRDAFSKNMQDTLTPKQSAQIGQRKELSVGDIASANRLLP